MTYHFGNNEYYHLVGRALIDESNVIRIIQGMRTEYDEWYNMTDGYMGNAYRVYLMVAGSDEMESLPFRNFKEVVAKYGKLMEEKPEAELRLKTTSQPSMNKWAKIHPEETTDVVKPTSEKLITPEDLAPNK